MSYRRRHRWFRRLALGYAFAVAASAGSGSVAYAKFDEGTENVQVIPYLSHGILTEADRDAAVAETIHDPYLTDVFARPGEAAAGPDGKLVDEWATAAAIRDRTPVGSESLGRPSGDEIAMANAIEERAARQEFIPGVTDFPRVHVDVPAVRPDDLRNRFAHSDVAPQAEPQGSGWTFEQDEALTMGIGAIVLGLGLGLAVGYLRRPRLAGL